MDKLTNEQRSYNMSQIRGKNTKPEEIVRKYFVLPKTNVEFWAKKLERN